MLDNRTFVWYNNIGDNMRVERIKKTKDGKYTVTIDGKLMTTYDDVILKNKILYQKEIDEKTYTQIGIDSIYYDNYHKALNYILRKLRSTLEVRTYLEDLDTSDIDIEKIIDRLKEIGFINDVNYAKAYISDSIYLRNDGPHKIKSYLLSQEIDEDVIDEELSKLDREVIYDKLEKLIIKKLRVDKKNSAYQLRQKIVIDMVNLGYSKDMILEILENYHIDDGDKLAKEYDKLYAKYSKKLKGYDLDKKIREKLYRKGIDIHDIENYIATKKVD